MLQEAAACIVLVPNSSLLPLAESYSFRVVETNRRQSMALWQAVCQKHGGRLASINSAAEQKLAVAALKSTRKRAILTGMKRIMPHKYFINTDGMRLKYT